MTPQAKDGRNVREAGEQFYRWIFGIGYERNVGGTERTLRYLGGVVLLGAAAGVLFWSIAGPGLPNLVIASLLAITGLYLIYEAQVQYCPGNHVLGRSTYRR